MLKAIVRRTAFLLTGLLAIGQLFAGHPTLQEVWARHDQTLMGALGKPVARDSSQDHVFKGKAGRTVHGIDIGPEAMPPVLWWNGGPGLPADTAWDSFCFAEAGRYRHLEIDSPGTGLSSWVEGWRPEDTVDDAAAFLRLRGITTPILVVGYSWGSTMALLFAQRHPELVRGVVIGGVWANTKKEVEAYLGVNGNRIWMPGVSDAFRGSVQGPISASSIHAAIRSGRGGKALCLAYDAAETLQAVGGRIPLKALLDPIDASVVSPLNIATETDPDIRFAFIESEMMARGEQGKWSLKPRFPKALERVPIIIVQGRFDQICSREVAQKVLRAWPCKDKLLVPMNGGHLSFGAPPKETLELAGLVLTEPQRTSLRRAMGLHYGNVSALFGAAIDCLMQTGPSPQ